MDSGKQCGPSHLFLLRTWAEDGGEQGSAWCARVQHIFTGEARTFPLSPELADVLLELMAGSNSRQQMDKTRAE